MIKKISVQDLRPGMTVARMQSDIWCHCPYLYTKEGPVTSDDMVRRIMDEGFTEVFIDTEAETAPSEDRAPEAASQSSRTEFSCELKKARTLYAQALLVAQELFTAASKGKNIDTDAASEAVEALHDSIERNPGALGCLARLAGADAYLYAHSVNVSVLAMLVGQQWGLGSEGVHHLGLAGLFHDLGKTRLPIGLLNRRDQLTAQESKLMEGHCVHGLAILEASAGVPREVKRAVVEHHERYDGNGYPFKLEHGQISEPGRLLSLADCFDALVSKRTYKQAMPPSRALSIMYGMRGADFAAEDVDRFIKIVGVYPSGSLVKLTTGEVAVVCEVNPAAPLAPLVNVVLDASLNPMTPLLADLAGPSAEGQPERVVEDYLDGRTLDRDPLQFLLVE